MTSTITSGSISTTPDQVLGYEATVDRPVQVHRIIGRGDPDVTLSPAGLRTGTLHLFYLTAQDADAALTVLSQVGTFTLATDDLGMPVGSGPDGVMRFVPSRLHLRLEGRRWVLDVDYQEVAA
ncbi:hypothetical protein [Cellulomonas composti]|uniref:Uncharacterized protein n=1 Tax=Cellulomonas composti TaxID=266130 RepID=A0A511JBL4_9CELL|nr:hypothetical protein [Cellulomonas composti]GEL95354.1 hypothetical protein CCO02nite_20120 [Cellulomonas composti]